MADPADLLAASRAASEALDAARQRMRAEKTQESAMAYCRAFVAAKTAREALPKPRLVAQ